MRVTDSISLRDFLRDLDSARTRMIDAQNKVSTGRSILRPSDSPRDMSDILRLRADKAEYEQYERNLEWGRSRLDFADTALASIQDMVERVRFLALSAIGSETVNDALSVEVEGLRDQILGTANSAVQGRYIFGGSDGETVPFQKDPSTGVVTYQGNSDEVRLQVGRSTTLGTQIPGDELFGAGNDIFLALSDLVTAMQSGDKTQIDAKLQPIESAWEGVSLSRTRVGGLVNVAASISAEISAMSLVRESNTIELESADLAKALTEFQSYENAIQASLAIGARISQLSLLDFI